MATMLRPTRPVVSDMFKVLGFTVHTGTSPSWFEVALATDPTLFAASSAPRRTGTNFWSSRSKGALYAERGEAVFLVPAEVVARFRGRPRIYYALATFASPDRHGPQLQIPPADAAPFVSVSSDYVGPGRRLPTTPNGGHANGNGNGYDSVDPAVLRWAGDDAQPGAVERIVMPPTPATPDAGVASPAGNGNWNASAAALAYDDGYDSALWTEMAEASPDTMDTQDSMSETAVDDPGIDGPIPDEMDVAAGHVRPLQLEYPQGSRFVAAHSGNYRAHSGPRTINRIVIHITDGGARISGPISWFQNPAAKVSAHYVVGQDGEVVQMVRHDDVAWHASRANGDSIGIEHVANTKGLVPTDAEYAASAALVRWLCDMYGLPCDRTHVLGHAEADPRTTHTGCPNAVWDWDHYMYLVTNAVSAAMPEAQGSTSRARALGDPIDVTWDDVFVVAQPTDDTCWAASASMLIGWRDRMSINPQTYIDEFYPKYQHPGGGLDQQYHDEFGRDLGLIVEPAMCYTVEGFADLLAANGPLWVAYDPWGGHAVVVTGMHGDGTREGTTVVFQDPQPTGQGRANVSERFDRFMEMFERYATTDQHGNVNIQIIHTGGRGGALSMAAARQRGPVLVAPARAARPLSAEAVVSGATWLVDRAIEASEDDVHWSLDQMNRTITKDPGDVEANRGTGAWHRQEVDVEGPRMAADFGVVEDAIYADFRVGWDYNGRSIKNVDIEMIKAEDAATAGLNVAARILDDAAVYGPAGQECAGLRVKFSYRFSWAAESSTLATVELHIFGNGSHDLRSETTQA